MNFQNLIQASATVIQITELKKWDVFKMISEEYSSPKLSYGVVVDVMNDWTKWFVQAIKVSSEYNDIKKEVKLLSEKEMEKTAIFPSSWQEVQLALSENLESAERSIKSSEAELQKKKESLEIAKQIISWEYLPVETMQTPKFQQLA